MQITIFLASFVGCSTFHQLHSFRAQVNPHHHAVSLDLDSAIHIHPLSPFSISLIPPSSLHPTSTTTSSINLIPDITDHSTIMNLATLAYDSYYEPEDVSWIPVPGYNTTTRFGWQDTGIRGYLFLDPDNNIIVVIKGTSLATPVGAGPTAENDKLNDNLMFSCCCAKAGWSWTAICDCPLTRDTCSKSCLKRELDFETSYYNLAQTIYQVTRKWFPDSNIFMVGHSLGGALASLVALKNGIPCVAFESPGEMLYADRLGLLPSEDVDEHMAKQHIYHFGNTGDPVFLGQCTGVTSSCYWLDYALESHCHLGYECIYDHTQRGFDNILIDQTRGGIAALKEVGAAASIQYHSIKYVLDKFITPNKVPTCKLSPECLKTECTKWKFVD